MRKQGKGWSFWIALVAVQALLLHAALGAIAPSAHAGVLQLDAFGNVLCAPASDERPQDGDRHGAPECCALGCATAFAAPVPAGDMVAIPVERPVSLAVLSRDFADLPPTALDHDPGNPRAPPLTV